MPTTMPATPCLHRNQQEAAAQHALAQAFDQTVAVFGAARLAAALVARQSA